MVPIGVEPHKRQHTVSMSVASPCHLTNWLRRRQVDRQLPFLVPLVRIAARPIAARPLGREFIAAPVRPIGGVLRGVQPRRVGQQGLGLARRARTIWS